MLIRHAIIGPELTRMHEQRMSAKLAEFKIVTADRGIATRGYCSIAGSQAVDVMASVTGRGRNESYRLMLSQRGDAGDVVWRRSVKAWEPRQYTCPSHSRACR